MTKNYRGKYAGLLDEAMWGFIDETVAHYPENAVELSFAEQRKLYDSLCEQFRATRPSKIVVADSVVNTTTHSIPTREYQIPNEQPEAHILYFHGGGFVVGGLDSHDDICAELCAGTRFKVTAIDYRLAPEYVFPAAHEDAVTSFEHLSTAEPDLPVILVGDSAGANLVASLSHCARDFPIRPVGQVLIYPCLSRQTTTQSYQQHSQAPLLTRSDMHFYLDLVMGGQDCASDVRCFALADSNYSELPITYAFGASCDPLLDDSRLYCKKIAAAGGQATFVEEQGLVHGYLRARHTVPQAKESFKRIIDACKAVVA